MFGIGFQELVLLSLIGLIVLGPERLPRVANQIGGWLGQARRMTRVMKRQLEDEINFDKDLNIKPPNREPSTQPAPETPAEDDHDSPAHDAADPDTADGEVGDGEVGDGEIGDGDAGDDGADLAAATPDRSDDVEASAETPAESADADLADEPAGKEVS